VNSTARLVGLAAVSLVVGGVAGPLVLGIEIARIQFQYGPFIALYVVLVFAAGVAIVAVALVVLGIGRTRWRQARPFVVVGSGLAISTFASCQIASLFSIGCAELQSQGDQIVAAIEQSYTTSGAYPETLPEIGLAVAPTRFGPWSYGRKDSEFYLSVGDYGRDELELTYTPSDGWYCNR